MQNNPPSVSIQSRRQSQQGGDEIRITSEDKISALLDVLEDRDCRAILQTIDDRPLSAQNLATKCDLSLSTTYRKVNRLSQIGLADEEIDISCDGTHTTVYHSRFDSLQVSADKTGFKIVVSYDSE